jgi:hypothetical protein
MHKVLSLPCSTIFADFFSSYFLSTPQSRRFLLLGFVYKTCHKNFFRDSFFDIFLITPCFETLISILIHLA